MQYLWRASQVFYKNWWRYLVLIIGLAAIVKHIIIPVYGWVFQEILALFGINYLSYNNLGDLFSYGTLPLWFLLLLGLVVMVTAYIQFALTIVGVYQIAEGHEIRPRQIFAVIFGNLRSFSWPGFLLFMAYVVVVLPAFSTLFSSSLLRKLVLPDFVVTFLMSNWLYGLALLVLVLVWFFVGVRLIRVLPLMLIKGQPWQQAFANSWRATKSRFWRYLFQVIFVSLLAWAVTGLSSFVGVHLQLWFDYHWRSVSLASAIVLTFGVQVVQVLMGVFETIVLALVVIFPSQIPLATRPALFKRTYSRRVQALARRLTMVAVALVLIGFNVTYLVGSYNNPASILTISHRGVDGVNGVQNTIPVLEKTAQHHPDYIEMDLHETKDDQFVVMHDANLKALTGVNKRPHQLTLDEITSLTAHENGFSAPVASFDDYLATAERLHQKLLVEIKVSAQDSPHMMRNFTKKYGQRMVQDGNMLHSLSYPVILQSREMMPKIPASFILPYTLVLPQTQANAYTLEQTTLSQEIVDQAHRQNQKVFAWDIDDPDEMQSMIFMNNDGIITDNLSTLQSVINSEVDHPSYAKRMSQLLNVDWQSAF
ncbi:glycerophosphodiester phosphodiesterase [Lactobacillaceae bacterium L1_55_11]|nr:glycerophosphodiester phosphodiesterase [Lactobacillaceae bacterium L1_55_11]